MLEDTIDSLQNHSSVSKIEESDQYYHVYVTEYGNARVLNRLSDYSFGNFSIENSTTVKFNVKKQ